MIIIARKENAMTKTKLVLDYLMSGKRITQIEATEMFKTTRLASIIFELKDRGYNIITHKCAKCDWLGNQVSYAQYELIQSKNE